MLIDEAIPILHDMYNYYNDTDIDAYVGFDREDNDAVEIALDTMRKYQKINNLVKFYENAGTIPTFVLKEIIEDGNVD